ncbi:MAG TPA: rod shape-determining protein MreC [Nitrospira sp.]|jgi:rod shape-determining protein MreC|nr:rod shape-determining protein MreC [Nitrospira sp.]
MRMVNLRAPYNARRVALTLAVILLVGFLLLPSQLQGVFQQMGGPVGWIVSWPLRAMAGVSDGISNAWTGFVVLQGVEEENKQLRKELEYLKGQNSQLREAAAATDRLTALLEFKAQALPPMVAAQVIGRDTGNWYRTLILNKGESDGLQPDRGVITPAGVVGRIVKTTTSTSVVLLVTDPNNAIAGLIQRTRDEGIVEGISEGSARLKYIPLLSNARAGDRVVTSGLAGGFPRGLSIGTITRIDKEEGALFQSAELTPEVDVNRVEEVLVIQSPYVPTEGERLGPPGAKPKP